MAPPENVLFVCKLNPATEDSDLELIFSRFGAIQKCEIVRDWKTGDSLQYAFIEFEQAKSAEDAYFKVNSQTLESNFITVLQELSVKFRNLSLKLLKLQMEGCLIDDRRIHCDFSQSVSKQWNLFRRNGNLSFLLPTKYAIISGLNFEFPFVYLEATRRVRRMPWRRSKLASAKETARGRARARAKVRPDVLCDFKF